MTSLQIPSSFTLFLQTTHATIWIAFLLALLPWAIFIKMTSDVQGLLSLKHPDRGKLSAGASVLALSELSQFLLSRLEEERLHHDPGDKDIQNPSDIEIIIPAYNEEHSIKSCIQSIVCSALFLFRRHGLRTGLIVVDDRSSDRTHAIATDCKRKLEMELKSYAELGGTCNTQRPVIITVLTSDERPMGENWLGKTWASHTGFRASQANHLFFIDADVTIKETFLTSFLHTLGRDYEFAGFIPTIICKSLIDYIVQPHVALGALIMNKVSSSLDPGTKKPHAFGQCVYISRRAYMLTGGYAEVMNDPMETRGLAKNIARHGILAKNIAGGGLIDVYMYQNARSLWEGWTKNFFVSVDKDIVKAFSSVLLALILFDLPIFYLLMPGSRLLVLAFIGGHFAIRVLAHRVYRLPLQGWFLFPLGGVAIAVLMLASAYKVRSGKNWTWKGRSLSVTP